MKLNEYVASNDIPIHLMDYLRSNARKVNGLAVGSISAKDGTQTAAPTTGTWAQGDVVTNSAPVEAGGAGNKYVVVGWICTVGGTPGTWLQMRTLTGN
jgi:hypothetical protein